MTTTSSADAALLGDIAQIFQDVFDDETLAVTPAFSRVDNEMWDSMSHLNIIFGLENKFHIKFGVVDIEEIQSVADIMHLVARKTRKA